MPNITETQVLEAKRRARNYWEIDGLPTIAKALGVVFAGLWLWYFVQQHSWLSAHQRLDFTVCLAALILMDFRGTKLIAWVKARITYPRTGYVAPLKQQDLKQQDLEAAGDRRFWFFFLSGLWAAALVIQNPVVCILAGLVTGMALWWPPLQKRFAPVNVLFVCCYGMFGAIFLSTAPGAAFHPQRLGVTLIILGILGFFKGVFMSLRYLRRNPLQQS